MLLANRPSPVLPREFRSRTVTAVLGPTNTGKTHLAIERMVAHSSGLIGLPLRLLAREVYAKLVARLGENAVALVTGEEKIKPEGARYWVSTVEAMPRDLDVAFLAVDEIQLAADLERGHVFTDRLLNRRGREETLLLGAATMRPVIERLIPGANIIQRPRMSQLLFAGEKKITRLPRRTAIVAFSAEEVYAIAELIRRQRGGAAVVLGALSPRTRNAQVDLYQNGDVDYLIATDAIGMGLNLDVDHVAFAGDRKFDGFQFRRLNPAEVGQIAGRAGRASRDGSFGTTGRCDPFDKELVERLESHAFEPVKVLQWRNTALDFASIARLRASLDETPREEGLTRAPFADDIMVLERAARDEDVRDMAHGRAAVERLWETCQLPDYRKISPASHADLVMGLYGQLMRQGRIASDWFARQIAATDRTDGDIDTLSTRIAHIRTWSFVAARPDWLDDPDHWQGVTRAVEDRLSDALHERLTLRFVDRRTSVLMRRLRENAMLETEITKTGEVIVEGHTIGHLHGFRFQPDAGAAGSEAKALEAAARSALAGEIATRANRLAEAGDDQIVLASDGALRWLGETVAKIAAGETPLAPRVILVADEQLTGDPRDRVEARLTLWLKAHVEKLLGPLSALEKAEDITGLARGIAFQLVEALGVLDRAKVADDVKSLDQDARGVLRKHGIRFGAYHIYLPALLKPAPRALAARLWALSNGGLDQHGLDEVLHLAASGRTTFALDEATNKPLYRLAGYRPCGERAVRVDILERLADLIRPALSWRPVMTGEKPAGAFDGHGFVVTGAMTSLLGATGEDLANILRSLGYRMEQRPAPVEAPPVLTPVAAEATGTEVSVEESAAPQSDAPVSDAAEAPATEAVPVAEMPASEAATDGTSVEAAAAPAMLEVWRPGRPPGSAPRRHERPRHQGRRGAPTPQSGEATATGEQSTEARPNRDRDQRSDRGQRPDRGPRREDRPQGNKPQGERHRDDRPKGERPFGDRKGPRRDGDNRREDRKPMRFESAPERPAKAIDPDSPFAKLLELKARMDTDRKK